MVVSILVKERSKHLCDGVYALRPPLLLDYVVAEVMHSLGKSLSQPKTHQGFWLCIYWRYGYCGSGNIPVRAVCIRPQATWTPVPLQAPAAWGLDKSSFINTFV